MYIQDKIENIVLALQTIRAHKLRSFLTVLGVVIGTMTVIAVSSVLTGLNKRTADLAAQFGPNVFFITRSSNIGFSFHRPSAEERTRKPVKFEDALALRSLPAVEDVSPQMTVGSFGPSINPIAVKHRGVEANNPIIFGVWANYPRVRNVIVKYGRFFSELEDERKLSVAAIGTGVADQLFGPSDPIGKEITVEGRIYRVIGVLDKAPTGLFGQDSLQDRQILVPFETLAKSHPEIEDISITVHARDGQMLRAIDQVTEVMRRRRAVPPDKPNNFGLNTPDAIFETITAVTAVLALIVVPISAAGLLIGGVGVMNIMLVSVTERTREIGIRRAIGARSRDILWQFLTEAMSLTAFGGVMGIAVGFAISMILNVVIPSLPSSVPLWSVAAGFGVSVAIGLFFGIWPAMKASRLNPIDALRYE